MGTAPGHRTGNGTGNAMGTDRPTRRRTIQIGPDACVAFKRKRHQAAPRRTAHHESGGAFRGLWVRVPRGPPLLTCGSSGPGGTKTCGFRAISRRLGTARERTCSFLLPAGLVTADGEQVELAHESLIQAWPRLRSWLDEDVEGQRTLRHLTA